MATQTVKAVYRNGSLKLNRKLPLPNNATVILRWRAPLDQIEATRHLIKVPRRVVLELTTPHRFSLWNP